MKDLKEIMDDLLRHEMRFRYMILDRMRCDCLFYLGNGHRLKKYLWAGDEKLHIEVMRALHNSFPEGEKPEWLSLDDIDNFEREMVIHDQ